MAERIASAALIRAMAAQMRGEELSDERASEIADDLNRIVSQGRAAASGNDFNDEPSLFTTVLARLARQTDIQP